MDIITLTRQLGAALQQDERYLAFQKATAANEADEPLNELMHRIQLVHMSYQHEASLEEKNEQKLDAYDREFNELYAKVMENPNMQNYEAARQEVDNLMRYITEILTLCIRGEDPETCEPKPHDCHDGCGHDGCDSCEGCHG